MEFFYWGIKGRAEVIRIMLAYLKLPYKEINPKNFAEGLEMINSNNVDFPNLPFVKDGDLSISESQAIPIYLAFKSGIKDFFGKDPMENVKHQVLHGVLFEINMALFEVTFLVEDFINYFEQKNVKFEQKFSEMSKFLANKDFFFGHLTYDDLFFFVTIDLLEKVAKGLDSEIVWSKFENLRGLKNRVANLDGIKEYLAKEENKKRPFFPRKMLRFKLE